MELCNQENNFKFLYDENDKIENKILTIAQKIYGAKDVEYSDLALEKINKFTNMGYGNLPICMAKTPNSLTDDAKIYGCPKDFTIHVRDVNVSAGAGFIVVYLGAIMTMPGLPKHPAAYDMGVDENGISYGIF